MIRFAMLYALYAMRASFLLFGVCPLPISLVNYEILESKYKEWDTEVPPELQDFFKNRVH